MFIVSSNSNWLGVSVIACWALIGRMAAKSKSEDIIGLKVDRCISDVLIKTGISVFWKLATYRYRHLHGHNCLDFICSTWVGSASYLFLGRPWPLIFGAGFGLGMGTSNCNNDFKQPLPLQSHRIKVHKEPDSWTYFPLLQTLDVQCGFIF